MATRITSRIVDAAAIKVAPYEIRDADLKGFLLRVQPSGTKAYYYQFKTAAGKNLRVWIGKHGSIAPAQAREAAERYAGNVALGKNVQQEKKEARLSAQQEKFKTLGGFIEHKYEGWVTVERKSGEATIARVKKNFTHLLNRPLNEINLWVIEKWRSERLKAGIKASTVNRDITTLKAILSKALEWDVLDKHPLAKLKRLPTDNLKRVRYLSLEEEQRLRETLNKRDQRIRDRRTTANQWRKERGYELRPEYSGRYVDHLQPLVQLALNTGMRRGELFSLKWQDVTLTKAQITIHGATAKSGKTRHIPLNQEALAVLKQWKAMASADAELVFPGRDNTRLDNVNSSWETLLKHAGINGFRWHDMRHNFASRLVMAGVDLNTVRELLGHSDITMTLRYAHLAPEHKAKAVEKIVQEKIAV